MVDLVVLACVLRATTKKAVNYFGLPPPYISSRTVPDHSLTFPSHCTQYLHPGRFIPAFSSLVLPACSRRTSHNIDYTNTHTTQAAHGATFSTR